MSRSIPSSPPIATPRRFGRRTGSLPVAASLLEQVHHLIMVHVTRDREDRAVRPCDLVPVGPELGDGRRLQMLLLTKTVAVEGRGESDLVEPDPRVGRRIVLDSREFLETEGPDGVEGRFRKSGEKDEIDEPVEAGQELAAGKGRVHMLVIGVRGDRPSHAEPIEDVGESAALEIARAAKEELGEQRRPAITAIDGVTGASTRNQPGDAGRTLGGVALRDDPEAVVESGGTKEACGLGHRLRRVPVSSSGRRPKTRSFAGTTRTIPPITGA